MFMAGCWVIPDSSFQEALSLVNAGEVTAVPSSRLRSFAAEKTDLYAVEQGEPAGRRFIHSPGFRHPGKGSPSPQVEDLLRASRDDSSRAPGAQSAVQPAFEQAHRGGAHRLGVLLQLVDQPVERSRAERSLERFPVRRDVGPLSGEIG